MPHRALSWTAPLISVVGLLFVPMACGGDDASGTASPDAGPDAVGPAPTPPADAAPPMPDAAGPSPFSGFSFGGAVTAAVHVGTSWYVGGEFAAVQLTPAPRLAVLDTSGASAGCDLGSGFDGSVDAAVVLGSSVYVGGSFEHYRTASAKVLAKIDLTTCALDTTFSPTSDNGFDQPVHALATIGSALFVGGSFTKYRGSVSANRIAKLDAATGALDTTFSPGGANGFNEPVLALAASGSTIFAGGLFTLYRDDKFADRIAKLDAATGALDETFGPQEGSNGFDNGRVHALAVSGGAVYAGGDFDSYRYDTVNRYAKLDATTGAVAPALIDAPLFDRNVLAITVSGSSVYVGGSFSEYAGAPAKGLAKLDATTHALDPVFSPGGADQNGVAGPGRVSALALFGGSLYVGGEFTTHRNKATSTKVSNLVKVDPATGALQSALVPSGHDAPGVDGPVAALVPAEGRLIVGGAFTGRGGRTVGGIVKMDDATFEIDTTFSPPGGKGGFDGPVYALASAGDALYVGGSFRKYRGVEGSARNLAKLALTNGAIDTTFGPPGATTNGTSGAVYALSVSGSSLFVGGRFELYRAAAAKNLVKVSLTTGAPDATISADPYGAVGFTVYALAASGPSLFVGGYFAEWEGGKTYGTVHGLAKVNATTGALDSTFDVTAPSSDDNGFGMGSWVQTLAVAGNAVYAGGTFSTYRGESANFIAKIDATNGALDKTFSPAENGFDFGVNALAVVGSSLYAGGSFSSYRGSSADALVKLDAASGARDGAFGPPGGLAFGLDGPVALVASDGATLLAGGVFGYYGGAKWVSRLARLDPATGALR